MNEEIIFQYFKDINDEQRAQFRALGPLYQEWNAKINVISRKDIDNLYMHHVLHSLGIAKVVNFRQGSNILDIGTGGGFPGIPLAILFPNCKFKLIDSIGKKTRVAAAVANAIGLKNVVVEHRNVINATDLVKLIRKNVSKEQRNALPNGLICLKGGDMTEEVAPFKNHSEIWELKSYFDDEFFDTKKVMYIQL